jgi:hypothetical protein
MKIRQFSLPTTIMFPHWYSRWIVFGVASFTLDCCNQNHAYAKELLQAVTKTRDMIITGSSDAVAAGEEILRKGGTAVE